MIDLAMVNPSKEEKELTKNMPDQVAIGYIKAKRKKEGNPVPNIGDLFGGIFS